MKRRKRRLSYEHQSYVLYSVRPFLFKRTGLQRGLRCGVYLSPLLTLVAALLLNATILAPAYKQASYASDIAVSAIFTLANQQRTAAGSPALTENPQLMTAAANKAADMFAEDYWAHDSPTGKTPWDFITAAGYNYAAAAENLAEDFDTSDQVVSAWMNSTEHRTNLLNSRYQDVGIAVVNGTLLDEQTTLVVMEFGQPAVQPPPAAVTQPSLTRQTPPVATVAPKPQPAPAPTKVVVPKPVVAVRPVTMHSINPNPLLSLAALHATVQSVNWAQWLTLTLVATVFVLNYIKQSFVWRAHRRTPWYARWLRTHPLFQMNLAACAGALMVGSSAGLIH